MHNPLMPSGMEVFQVLGILVWGAVMLFLCLIGLALVVLLARFLWVGTKAAKLYIASHEPLTASPSDAVPTVADTAVPDATAPVAPPTKPRKPKG